MKNSFINSLETCQTILENAIEGILIAEIDSKRFKYANPALARMFGYSQDEMTALSLQDIHPEDQLPIVLNRFRALARGEIELARGLPCKRKNGDIFWADISGSKIAINGIACNVGFFSDVSEFLHAEKAIHQTKKQFESLFMSMSDGFYLSEILYDDRGEPCDYRYLEVNPAFERIVGLKRDQIIGRRYKEIVPVDTTQWLQTYCAVARTGTPMSYEFYSSEYDMYFETYSYQPAKGQVCVLVRNITERKRIEETLRNTQRLESLGILAGGIAHDFNNILSGIFGYIDLARSQSKKEKSAEYLDSALQSMDRARALTFQLLTFAKGGAPIQKITPLVLFIQETVQFALSGSNVISRFEIADDLRPCNIDKNQIGQVIDNIVINAQQAMPGGGEIKITAENVSLGENSHPLLSAGDYVRLSIKDSGIGIPKDILPRIFDPFFTTKTKGHGLGLATSFSIVKRHGGCIDAESSPGKGSCFHVYLPASTTPAVSEAKRSSKHIGSGTILVVDDEEVLRNILQQMLESLGYTVECRNEGKTAVDFFYAEMQANRGFAACIMDLTIPGGMGGLEAVAAIRKLNATVPVFVVSGYSDDPVMRNPGDYGFTASIPKPFTINELSEILTTYIK